MLRKSGEVKPEVIAQNELECYVCGQRKISFESFGKMLKGATCKCPFCGAKHAMRQTMTGRRVFVIGVFIK